MTNFLNLSQRGYVAYASVSEATLKSRTDYLNSRFPIEDASALRKAADVLTLTSEKQSQIALWSGGPRFVAIPYGSYLILDMVSIPAILKTLFYRVQHEQTARGTVFEDAMKQALLKRGYAIPKVGDIFALDGTHREIDVSVRIGSHLVIFECRSIERPLDYEIGRSSTFSQRQTWLDQKIDQALSLKEFLRKNPKGTNYDFSWAQEISAFVVSPFVEWLWNRSERLWHKGTIPRILQADEALSYLQEIREGNAY